MTAEALDFQAVHGEFHEKIRFCLRAMIAALPSHQVQACFHFGGGGPGSGVGTRAGTPPARRAGSCAPCCF